MNLLEMLANHNEDDAAPQIDPDAAIARLRERAVAFAEADKGPRFAIDDLVMPVRDASVHGFGRPHLVIAVRHAAEYDFSGGDLGSVKFGRRVDMRILVMSGDDIAPHWVESAEFTKYEAESPR